jgi:hypothetical protein
MNSTRMLACALAAAACAGGGAFAQTTPSTAQDADRACPRKSPRLIAPLTSGGSNDALAASDLARWTDVIKSAAIVADQQP